MAVKFGTDGTLYCNTVKYNYKQARNMIADGSYGNVSSSSVWKNVAYTNNKGYKAYRCFNCTYTNGANLEQTLPALTANHIYYFSCYYNSTASASYATIVINALGSDIKATNLYLGSTSGNWVKSSKRFTATQTYNDGTQKVVCWVGSSAGTSVYISKFILVDLTDTFGAGNEPTQAWCDNNIREQEVYHNFGSVTTAINYSKVSTAFTGTNFGSFSKYNYLQSDSVTLPREYRYILNGSSSYNYGELVEATKHSLNNAEVCYTYWEAARLYHVANQTCVFGVTNGTTKYSLGTINMADETLFNGGGKMNIYKRVSAFGSMSGATGSYALYIQWYNNKGTGSINVTALNLNKVSSNITQYNNYNGTSIVIGNVNKEWCDRWLDCRSSPIIHIKDPANRQIKINTSYDIICNDIEIRPEINTISFDETGTIKCKKLVRTQNY